MFGVILAGGGGTRLWPQSRAALPKPFLPLLPGGLTMIQATFNRLIPLIPADRLFVGTGPAYAEIVRQQLPELPASNVIVEPSGRDNAAAVGLAIAHLARRDPTATMGVFSADHLIADEVGFRTDIALAARVAEAGYLVTLGMKPTGPDPRFGYVEIAGSVPELAGEAQARRVARFVEKPDLATATAFVNGGRHYWNAGIFVWRITTIQEQFRQLQPEMAARLAAIQAALGTPDEAATLAREWEGILKTSVDYAIMEKAPQVATILSDIGWSDVGDWHALGDLLGQPGQGFVSDGADHLGLDSRNCVIAAPAGKLVATIGLEELVIIDTPDALLVCPRSRTQEVKQIVDSLKSNGRDRLL